MQLKKAPPPVSEINVTPMVDVMLVLLIIFMVITPMLSKGVSVDLAKTRASFDDPDLVSHAGLVPVMGLAQRAGLGDLVAEHVRPGGACGVNAAVKVPCLVAGMAAGAGSIEDMGLLRHGAMGALFGGIRAPSTLGSHLRCYTWGNVSQLEKASREFLAELPDDSTRRIVQ